MLIRFADEIKSEGFGNIPVNKEKCYVGFLRLNIRAGSNEVRTKSDRYNPSALERWGGLQKSAWRKEVQRTARPAGWKMMK